MKIVSCRATAVACDIWMKFPGEQPYSPLAAKGLIGDNKRWSATGTRISRGLCRNLVLVYLLENQKSQRKITTNPITFLSWNGIDWTRNSTNFLNWTLNLLNVEILNICKKSLRTGKFKCTSSDANNKQLLFSAEKWFKVWNNPPKGILIISHSSKL